MSTAVFKFEIGQQVKGKNGRIDTVVDRQHLPAGEYPVWSMDGGHSTEKLGDRIRYRVKHGFGLGRSRWFDEGWIESTELPIVDSFC